MGYTGMCVRVYSLNVIMVMLMHVIIVVHSTLTCMPESTHAPVFVGLLLKNMSVSVVLVEWLE